MKKKAFVYKLTFSKLPKNLAPEPDIMTGTTHIRITEERISYTIMSQCATKTLSPNKINFRILRII